MTTIAGPISSIDQAGPPRLLQMRAAGADRPSFEVPYRLLEMIVDGEPAAACLDEVCRVVEGLNPTIRVAVSTLGSSHSVSSIAAPTLNGLGSAMLAVPMSRAAGLALPSVEVVFDLERGEGSPEWRLACDAMGLWAGIVCPVTRSAGDAVGAVFVGLSVPRELTEGDEGLAELGARLAGLVLRRSGVASGVPTEEPDREVDPDVGSLATDAGAWDRVIESLDVAAYTIDASGTITAFNEAATRLWGRRPERGEKWCGCLNAYGPDGSRLRFEDGPMVRALAGDPEGAPREVVLERPDGSRRLVMALASPVLDGGGHRVGAVGLLLDVTDQEPARLALARSEQRYRTIVESQLESICRFTAEGTILFANEAYARSWGTTVDRLEGTNLWGIVHPDDRVHVQSMLDSLSPEHPEVRIENRVETVQGTRWTLWTNRALTFGVDGRAIEIQSTGVDITERKGVESALRESEERFRTLADNMAQLAWMKDPTGWTCWYNKRWYDYTGTTFEQMEGWGWRSVHHPDHVERVLASFTRALELGVEWEESFPLRRADGVYRWFLTRAIPIRDGSGRIVRWFGTNTDITDRLEVERELERHKANLESLVEERTRELRETYERLRMSERLAMMGTLSAGLGHDMGNLLLPVRVRLDSLAAEPLSPQAREDVEAIGTAAEYLRRLAGGLRLLSSDGQRESGNPTAEVSAWWGEAQGVLRCVLPRRVSLEAEIPPGLPALAISKAALTQIIFNLVQNAGDVMRERGRGRVLVRAIQSDGRVGLQVIDDGPGMTPEVRRRCMEPFFTTKTQGVSSGLGLALVYALTSDRGGQVELESTLGQGTTFTVWLPAASTGCAGGAAPASIRAVVEVQDSRLRSLIVGELRSLGVREAGAVQGTACNGDDTPGGHEGLTLHVVDDPRRLGSIAPDAPVLVLGSAEVRRPGPTRAIPARPELAAVRAALREILKPGAFT